MNTTAQKRDTQTARIRELNDQFRITGIGGTINVTRGIADMAMDCVHAILQLVKRYEEFTEDNDPHGENDFGSFRYRGDLYFWKIDYYDLNFQNHSPDPANPKVTNRVLTVMLAEEY